MTTAGIFLNHVRRLRLAAQVVGTSLALAVMSAVAVSFYLYAYLSVAQLQQLSPDQLIRAMTGA